MLRIAAGNSMAIYWFKLLDISIKTSITKNRGIVRENIRFSSNLYEIKIQGNKKLIVLL